jgi:hypothetical protein
MKDFSALRSDIGDAVKALDDAADKIDAILFQKKETEIKVP